MYDTSNENIKRIVEIVCLTNACRTMQITELTGKRRRDDVLTVDDERQLAMLMREHSAECRGAIRLFIALADQASATDNRAAHAAAPWN